MPVKVGQRSFVYKDKEVRFPFPVGWAQLISVYGIPEDTATWQRQNLATVSFPWGATPLGWGGTATKVRVNKKVVEVYECFFDHLYVTGDYALIKTYDGTWNYRLKRASGHELSTHSFGIPIDLNKEGNELGKPGTQPWHIVEASRLFGFEWGGLWSYRDAMHFQLCSGF